jgi:hypothetical protein
MRIGIISEGHSDRAVIVNLILGATTLERTDIKALRPIYLKDVTDMAANKEDDKTIGTWSNVKKECEDKGLISAFLSIEGQDFVIIHLDTAEAEEYDVKRPDKGNENYCEQLRSAVIEEIKKWLKGEHLESMIYAVAIEETEAWLLSIHTEIKNTVALVKPKEKMDFEFGKKDIDTTSDWDNYLKLSKPLKKVKAKERDRYNKTNCSLRLLYEEIIAKLPT